ncbi:MAG: hypothetical protein CVV45_15045, partial [Spirochaetae bacterium HGW-Spirochaetae-10]
MAGLAAAYYYYTHQKKELPGGFWGAAFVAIIGAVLITMLAGLEAWFIRLVSWLMQPKFGDVLLVRVNLITAVIGAFPWAKVPVFIAAQMLGAFLGAVLVWLAYLPHWAETDDKDGKLAVFCTGPAIRHTLGNVLCEFIGTALLLFGVLAIGAN